MTITTVEQPHITSLSSADIFAPSGSEAAVAKKPEAEAEAAMTDVENQNNKITVKLDSFDPSFPFKSDGRKGFGYWRQTVTATIENKPLLSEQSQQVRMLIDAFMNKINNDVLPKINRAYKYTVIPGLLSILLFVAIIVMAWILPPRNRYWIALAVFDILLWIGLNFWLRKKFNVYMEEIKAHCVDLERSNSSIISSCAFKIETEIVPDGCFKKLSNRVYIEIELLQ